MTQSTSQHTWKDIILKLIETILSTLNKRKRTWNQHVVPYKDQWAVRREGNKRVTSKHRKQSTAITKAKVIAKKHKAAVIIHGEDGKIRDQIQYQ